MKVAVVTNAAPFVSGGAESLAAGLVRALGEHGHEAILVRYPFVWNPAERVLQSMLACSMMRLPNVDRVIGLKFPAYFVPHPDKVLWLLHQFRQAYDLWGTPYQDLPENLAGHRVRRAVLAADDTLLRQARKIYTISDVVSARLARFNRIASDVLYHPLPVEPAYRAVEYGDFIFCPSRMTPGKRQLLLIDAMRYTRTPVRLVLAGASEPPYSADAVRNAAEATGNSAAITLHLEYLPQHEKRGLIERCLAGGYAPVDEDSYGYVTLEHFRARKAVITCTDSGGTHILVKDGVTGCVVPPDPRELAAAFDRLYENRALARRLGEDGHALQGSLNISWDNVVRKLTA